MKRFLKKILIMLSILSVCCAALFLFDFFAWQKPRALGYQAAVTDKLQRLESIDEPKIILVGHSNVAFGINSKQLEDAMSMPVVNLGMHGGMGNVFHENLAKANINKGDIVVVCHSSYDTDAVDGRLLWQTVCVNPRSFSFIDPKNYPLLLQSYPEYWRESFLTNLLGSRGEEKETCYVRKAFNEYGDIVLRPESMQVDESFFNGAAIPLPAMDDETVERLNRYNEYITAQGATMVVAGYPIVYGEYSTYTAADFQAFETELRGALDCDVISHYTDYFYPYEYFYDTYLHLTQEGTTARTAQLIADLQAWQASK